MLHSARHGVSSQHNIHFVHIQVALSNMEVAHFRHSKSFNYAIKHAGTGFKMSEETPPCSDHSVKPFSRHNSSQLFYEPVNSDR